MRQKPEKSYEKKTTPGHSVGMKNLFKNVGLEARTKKK